MAVRVLGERAKSLVLDNRRLTEQNQAILLSAGLQLADIELACHLAKGQIYQSEGGTDRTARASASDQRSGDEQVGALLARSFLRVKPRPVPGVPRGTAEMSVCGNGISNYEMGVGGTMHPQVGVIDSVVSSSVLSGSPRVLSVRSVPSHNSDDANTSMENSGAVGSGALRQRGEVRAHEGFDLHTTPRQFHNGLEIDRQGVGFHHQQHKWLVEVAEQLVIPASSQRNDGIFSPRPGDGVEETARGDSIEIVSPSLSTPRSSRVHWVGSEPRTPLHGSGSENEVPNPTDTIRVDEQMRRPRSLRDVRGSPTVGFHY
jgi:hypothetical protein